MKKNINNDINNGIVCNVKDCVFNEKGCNCNLEKVTISQGDIGHHYCKSFISQTNEEDNSVYKSNLSSRINITKTNIEASEEDYFDFDNLKEK